MDSRYRTSSTKVISIALAILAFGVILWVTEKLVGLRYLPYVLLMLIAAKPLSFIGTAATYLATGFGGLGLRKAIPYACFFLAGITVASFQWHIAFDQDRSGLIQYYSESLLLVPIAAFVGLLCSIRYLAGDRFLALIVGLTVFLGVMQFLWEVEVIAAIALNVYARAYAATATALPFIALGWNHYAQRSKGQQTEGRPDA